MQISVAENSLPNYPVRNFVGILIVSVFGHLVTKIGRFTKFCGTFDRQILILVITIFSQVSSELSNKLIWGPICKLTFS